MRCAWKALVALAVVAAPMTATAQTPYRLRWAPPETDPGATIQCRVGVGFFENDGLPYQSGQSCDGFPDQRPTPAQLQDKDVVLICPTGTQRGRSPMRLNGARSVTVIGCDLGRGSASFRNMTGFVFLEGIRADMSPEDPQHDVFNAYGPPGGKPDVYLQNIHVTGVHGDYAHTHADIFQPQGPIGTLRVDRLTGDTNYQGFFLPPRDNIDAVYISNTDLSYHSDTTDDGVSKFSHLFYFRFTDLQGRGDQPVNVFLDNVYAAPRRGQTLDQSVYPGPRSTVRRAPAAPMMAQSRMAGGGGRSALSWPAFLGIRGAIQQGPPPNGSFVQLGPRGPGSRYVSPGYQ